MVPFLILLLRDYHVSPRQDDLSASVLGIFDNNVMDVRIRLGTSAVRV